MLVWVVVPLILAAAAYVRLAPSDPARWHRAASPQGVETKSRKTGYIWRKQVEGQGKQLLSALDTVVRADPRTAVLAGSVEDGQITYISRSRSIGFPDYTTIGLYQTDDGRNFVEVYGRLRFGRSDLGVNAKRIKCWVAQIEP